MSQITGAITLETRRLVEEIAAGVVARLIENGVVELLAARVAEQLQHPVEIQQPIVIRNAAGKGVKALDETLRTLGEEVARP